MTAYIKNFSSYKALLMALTKKQVALKYRRSYLGIFWSLLNPLLTMIVLTIVFSTLFQRDIANFPVYLLSGKLIFDFHAQSTNAAMRSIVANNALIKKIYIPKYIFPLSEVMATFVNLFFSLIALALVMLVTGAKFHITLLLFWMPLIYLFFFSCGFGMLLATINVFFRDMSHLYSVILTAWTYFTPIFYPADIIPDKYYVLLQFNPLHHMVKMMRCLVIDGVLPPLKTHIICAASAAVAMIIGLFVFYKKQDQFILHI